MDDEVQKEKEADEFEKQMTEKKRKDEEKTMKNKAKRDKQKARKKKGVDWDGNVGVEENKKMTTGGMADDKATMDKDADENVASAANPDEIGVIIHEDD